jgi:co-chaperonin GroES (HSP10)
MILKPQAMAKQEETASVVGKVLAMGSDCYQDTKRFPNGPWCKVGDYILVRAYSGTRFLVDGHEFRLINDDTVQALVEEPEGITRI